MRTRPLTTLLAFPIALTAFVGCSPGEAPDEGLQKPDRSVNEVRDEAAAVVDELVEAFPGSQRLAEEEPEMVACADGDTGAGRWIWALAIPNLDIDGTIAGLQEEYGEAVTSTGTSAQQVEYADGTTWKVTGAHTLIEDATGSYLLSYPPGAGGTVTLRVVTACGVVN